MTKGEEPEADVEEIRVQVPRRWIAATLYDLIYHPDKIQSTDLNEFVTQAIEARVRQLAEQERFPADFLPLPPDSPLLSLPVWEPPKLRLGRRAPGAQVSVEVRNEVVLVWLTEGGNLRFGTLEPADVEFGEILPSFPRRAALRQVFGISRADLGALVGVSSRSVLQWKGDRNPDLGRDIRYSILLLILEYEAGARNLQLPDPVTDDEAWLGMVNNISQRRSARTRRGDPFGLQPRGGDGEESGVWSLMLPAASAAAMRPSLPRT